MNVFGLFGHIGLLIHVGKDVESIIEHLVTKKESWPSQDEWVKLLDDSINLLGSGLLNLPDPIVRQISEVLLGLKSEVEVKS